MAALVNSRAAVRLLGPASLRRDAQRGSRGVLMTWACRTARAAGGHARLCTPAGGHSNYDCVVVGGGIVGLATAREILARYPSLRLAVLEKEGAVGQHQTGHNSGVVHAGIYYMPGSLKARLCVEGLDLSYAYFRERNIPHEKCGKLIVAVSDDELPRLDKLYERGVANGVKDLVYMSPSEFAAVEPHCAGVRAIYSPHTGIVDWGIVAQHYAEDVRACRGSILLSHHVDGVSQLGAGAGAAEDQGVEIRCANGARLRSARAIFCAGAFSDRLARQAGGSQVPMIVPVRGEYLELHESCHHLVKGISAYTLIL
jgi:2-hydroxyglutarate dehydrogenase